MWLFFSVFFLHYFIIENISNAHKHTHTHALMCLCAMHKRPYIELLYVQMYELFVVIDTLPLHNSEGHIYNKSSNVFFILRSVKLKLRHTHTHTYAHFFICKTVSSSSKRNEEKIWIVFAFDVFCLLPLSVVVWHAYVLV